MAIYTKTGDRGETGLFGGRRVSKSDPIIMANGELDELTCTLGWARIMIDGAHVTLIEQVQHDIYVMMGLLAGYESPVEELKNRIEIFEQTIDTVTSDLPELHAFVIPGDTESSARLHVARAVCRRVERALVALRHESQVSHLDVIIRYMNRLSDLLFTLARAQTEVEKMAKR